MKLFTITLSNDSSMVLQIQVMAEHQYNAEIQALGISKSFGDFQIISSVEDVNGYHVEVITE